MSQKRRKFSPQEKAKIALEALKGNQTQSQLTSKYGVHATQINGWKRRLKEGIVSLFSDRRRTKEHDQDALIEELYRQIGQLKVELDWLKKKSVDID